MDTVLVEGDLAEFERAFAPATVTVRPGTLIGTGPATLQGRRMCLVGDESKVQVVGCPYNTPAFPTFGTGTLEIAALAEDQKAQKSSVNGTPMMLVGSGFTARFTVAVPAQIQTAAGPSLDTTTVYSGRGKFTSTNNTHFRGS